MNKNLYGWIVLDKAAGITSNRANNIVKSLLRAKVGYAGTLDPFATGVLPIAVGKATKQMQLVVGAPKGYDFTIKWGVETDSDDCDGEIVNTSDVRPSKQNILDAIPMFVGEIQQKPPIYSAIKIKGKRACDRVRAGEHVEMVARPVTIKSMELLSSDDDSATFRVCCGKGMYVRSLARDLAYSMGAFGHVSSLRRTMVGPFNLDDAIDLDFLEKIVHSDGDMVSYLDKCSSLLREYCDLGH